MEHLLSSLLILAASVFEISYGKTDRQTNRQTAVKTYPATAVEVGNTRHLAVFTVSMSIAIITLSVHWPRP